MEQTFEQKIAAKNRRRRAVKYFLPVGVGIFSLLMAGQLAVQFIPLNKLNKQSGIITGLATRIISRTHRRGSSHDTPNYALVITLDQDSYFNVQEMPYRIMLAGDLKLNDHITLYYPTRVMKFLCAGLVHDVNQIERGGQVLYSWDGQKKRTIFIVFVYAGMAIFLYLMRRYTIWIDK